MSVVIDNSNGNFLSQVDLLRELIDAEGDAELNEWRYLFVIHKFGLEEIVTKLNILNEEYDFLHASNPIEHIETRIKNPKKTVEKLIRQGYPVSAQSARENLHDIGGIRVVCSFVEDVYEIYEKLAGQSDLTIKEVKDYIKYPKDNGYRSLHLLVEVPVFMTDKTERVTIEVQIRTIAMDFWASLEHKLYYKKGKVVPRQVLIGLNQCADLAALLDEKMQDIRNKMTPYLSEEERAMQAADMAKNNGLELVEVPEAQE
ncbi:MAG: GTP pyrophosphokinase family protein [Peptococcaceae bacterium]|nr:GTP pyrophosphokinase family protein [Peptococcaceae bacterium]